MKKLKVYLKSRSEFNHFNLPKENEKGTHFIGISLSKSSVVYFDSYGLETVGMEGFFPTFFRFCFPTVRNVFK